MTTPATSGQQASVALIKQANNPMNQPLPLAGERSKAPPRPEIDGERWWSSPLPWRHPTMLAPMEGVSHPTFRTIMSERGGLGIVCTEFVRISSQAVRPTNLSRAVVHQKDMPLSVQVMGNDAALMAEAAGWMAQLGADVVDINLGCPSPRVVRRGVGSAMLQDVDLLRRVLEAMREVVPGMLSAKIRAGFDRADHFLTIGRAIEETGVDYLVVHPRKRSDFYQGVADWRIVRALKQELSIPVVGNGDIWYADDAFRIREETGCDAVMLGRPALRNPWIFQQIESLARGQTPHCPRGSELVVLLRDVAARYRAVYPRDKLVIGKLKEWTTYLSRAAPAELHMREVLRCQTIETLLDLFEEKVGDLDEHALDLRPDGHLGFERRGSALVVD